MVCRSFKNAKSSIAKVRALILNWKDLNDKKLVFVFKPWFALKRKSLMIFYFIFFYEKTLKVSLKSPITRPDVRCLWSCKDKMRPVFVYVYAYVYVYIVYVYVYYISEATDSAKLQVAKNAFCANCWNWVEKSEASSQDDEWKKKDLGCTLCLFEILRIKLRFFWKQMIK